MSEPGVLGNLFLVNRDIDEASDSFYHVRMRSILSFPRRTIFDLVRKHLFYFILDNLKLLVLIAAIDYTVEV